MISPLHASWHRKFLKCLNGFGGDGMYCILSDSSAIFAGQKPLWHFSQGHLHKAQIKRHLSSSWRTRTAVLAWGYRSHAAGWEFFCLPHSSVYLKIRVSILPRMVCKLVAFNSKPLSLKTEFSVSCLNDNWIPLQAYCNIVNRVFILRCKITTGSYYTMVEKKKKEINCIRST